MLNDDLTISQNIRSLFDNAEVGRAFSRDYIADSCNTSDRAMRDYVAQLCESGVLIVADEGGGYRLATSSQDVLRYTASLRSRIVALARRVRAMESAAARQFGDFEQLPLDLAA